MTTRDTHSVGVPCRVDTVQPDPRAAMDFYGPLFGWSFDDPTPMPAGLEGDYFAARLRGRLVAGIGQAPGLSRPTWNTHVRVDDVAQAVARAEQAEVRAWQDRLVSAQMAALLWSPTPPASRFASGRLARPTGPCWPMSRIPGR